MDIYGSKCLNIVYSLSWEISFETENHNMEKLLVNIPTGMKRRTSAEVTSGLLPELAAGQPRAD